MHEPPRQVPHSVDWLHGLRRPLHDRNFLRYVGLNFTFTLAVGFMGQYIWLYLFDIGQVKAWLANLFLVVMPRLVHMYSYSAWGKLIDRLGRRPILIVALALMTISPFGWFLVGQPDDTLRWIGYAIALIGIFAYPGFEIANFNIILSISGGREGGSSAYVVVNSAAIALGGVLSGLLGYGAAHMFESLNIALPLWDMTLTYHGLLLGLSALLRFAALPWAFAMHEPASHATSDALRYMGANVYSNVRQAILMPTRVVGRVSQMTWRMNNKR